MRKWSPRCSRLLTDEGRIGSEPKRRSLQDAISQGITNHRRRGLACVKSERQHEGATVGIGPPRAIPALRGSSLWSAAHLALAYGPCLLLRQPERGGAEPRPLRR